MPPPTTLERKVSANTPPDAPRPAGRPRNTSLRVDPKTEVVRPRDRGWLNAYTAGIRQYAANIDDVTADLGGIEVYEQQMMRHPGIAAPVDTLILGALGWRIAVRPPIPRSDDNYDTADKYARAWQFAMQQLPRPIKRVLKGLARGIITGHKIADLVWVLGKIPGEDGQKMLLGDIKVKPNLSYDLMGDEFDNVQGVLPRFDRFINMTQADILERTIPIDKFAFFVNDPELGDCNPLGTSILRVAWHAYWMSIQLNPDYLAFLATCAQPSADYELGPNEPEQYTIDGKQITARALGLQLAENVHNGSASAHPNGSTLKFMEVTSKGETFTNAYDGYDRRMMDSITGQHMAGGESKYQPRNTSAIHRDLQELRTQYLRTMLAFLLDTISRRFVAYNWGDDAVMYAPIHDLGQFATHDFSVAGQTVAQLTGQGYLHMSQFEEMDAMLGLPVRNYDLDPDTPGMQVAQPGAQPVQPAAPAKGAKEPQKGAA